jgi:hypothetical protein
MGNSLRERVTRRAAGRCEYCRIPSEYDEAVFCIDHVRDKKHHGPTELGNLALACYWCNSYKGDNLSGVDPVTGNIARLFDPRHDNWQIHFLWEGPVLVGVPDVARATIDCLWMNAPLRVALRSTLLDEGVVF